jgi:hypothetical protein
MHNIERYEDYIGFNHEVNTTSTLKTEITLLDYDGDTLVSITKSRPNMTTLGGRLDLIEKTFRVTPNKSQRLFVNDMIEIPRNAVADGNGGWTVPGAIQYMSVPHSYDIYDSETNPNRFSTATTYFSIGTGGENPNTAYQLIDVKPWETRLYNIAPFRFVEEANDLDYTRSDFPYRLRKSVVLNGKTYIGYYAKKFNPGLVQSKKNDISYLAPSVLKIEDSNHYIGNGQGHPMQGYVSTIYLDFQLDITADEFKEYYKATHNEMLTFARVSEIGIISGYDYPSTADGPTHNELSRATMFAHLTHEPVSLQSQSSRRTVMYRIYS